MSLPNFYENTPRKSLTRSFNLLAFFVLFAGTAHTSYSLLPIISEIAQANKIRPERPMSLSVIAASLGITGSPVSAATAALISQDILGAKGIELGTVLIVCVPGIAYSYFGCCFHSEPHW